MERRTTMKILRFLAVAALGALSCSLSGFAHAAFGETPYVSFRPQAHAAALVANGRAAPIWLDVSDFPGVIRAARDLQADIERVTGVRPELHTQGRPNGEVVLVAGTIGKSTLIDELVAAGKLDVSDVRGKWESFVVQVLARPYPGVEQAVVVAGSDKRGTIYGLYDISTQSGVSPWYWWADVPVVKRDALYVQAGRHVVGEPVVKYRGIFLNDEAPALSGWAHEKFGGFNHK